MDLNTSKFSNDSVILSLYERIDIIQVTINSSKCERKSN